MRMLPIVLVVLVVAVAGLVVILLQGGTETDTAIFGPARSAGVESTELVAELRSLKQAVERLTARLDDLGG
ncbi:MAG: hypothetical protein JW940_19215 [Polyangiaceae bacterium]|nr:hypothetical protein [Polyangiaceae bacterium]